MIRRRWTTARWVLSAASALAVLCAVALMVAHARPGGGHGYSGGGGGGGWGGGGGGGGGAILFLLVRLVFIYPQVGIPVVVAVAVGYLVMQRHNASLRDWDSVERRSADIGAGVGLAPGVADLGAIRQIDPDFSTVLFTDFAYALYAQAHRARADTAGLAALAPYLSPPTRRALAGRPPVGVPVATVVIGAMRVTGVRVPGARLSPQQRVEVDLTYESNITVGDDAQAQTLYVMESWRLTRAASAKSRPPGKTRSFDCPNCGAPFSSGDGTVCSYCGEVVTTGRFDWLVAGVVLLAQEARPPTFLAHAAEHGTELETICAADLTEQRAALAAADPQFSDDAFDARLELIFRMLNDAWGKQELEGARPYVSDNLFDYLGYYTQAYKQQGLRNINADARIQRWIFVKLVRDRYFDAITVRCWASGYDYTVAEPTGKVVGGSKSRRRRYSEYWTLIRSAATRGAARSDECCPQCGAELKITMAGTCEYCQAHVTAGEFDWVLSQIEQDEAYRG